MAGESELGHDPVASVATLYDQLGGEVPLRAIIERFVDRVFDDPMIGFFFARASRQRVKDKEFEFAAAHLGGPVTYTGRPIAEAHAKHPIMGGHFMRRLEILRQTLADFEAPAAVVEHWIANTETLRAAVTRHQGSDCSHEPAAPQTRLPLAQAVSQRRELPLVQSKSSANVPPKTSKGDAS